MENTLTMHSFIDIFAYKIYKEKLLSHGDIRKMKYAMRVIWNEGLKFVILLSLFTMLNKMYLFLFCLSLLLSIRAFSGGLHFESSFLCLIVSLSFFSLAILILPYLLPMPLPLAILLILISIIVICCYSPMPSRFRPISNQKRKRILKYLSLFFTLLWIYILFKFVFTYDKTFFECGIWTIGLQAFQLLIGRRGYQ
ncbi:accessory gene regulator B family protein [Geosporobacter ferrireducens]